MSAIADPMEIRLIRTRTLFAARPPPPLKHYSSRVETNNGILRVVWSEGQRRSGRPPGVRICSIDAQNRHLAIACASDTPSAIARTIAWRAVQEPEEGRLASGLIAQALPGHACPPADALDGWMVDRLRERLRDHLMAEIRRIKEAGAT